MSVGRRGLLLSVAFMGLAIGLSSSERASAQPGRWQPPPPPPFAPQDPGNGNHRIWNQAFRPEQIRDMLLKFGKDGTADDQFLELLRRVISSKNPDATPEQVDALAKRLAADKEFRDRIIDLAQKHKNQQPQNGNGEPAPKFTPDELAKLLKRKPEGVEGDPFKVPDRPFAKGFEPNQLPPFDPRNPNFDPKRFPKIDPNNPPEFDPDTRFPVDPNTKRPFDPRTGDPIDPKNPPKIAPPAQPRNPEQPPKFDPAPQKIDPPNNPDNNRKFDPDNPLGIPNEPPEKVAKTKAVETATALWEKNVGPIEESPAVRRAILDLVNDNDAMESLTDGNGNTIFDMLQKDTGGGETMGDWFNDGGSKWEWPKFDFSWSRGRGDDLDFNSRPDTGGWGRDSSRSGGSSSLDMGSFSVGSLRVPVLLLLVILALAAGLVAWWKWGGLLPARRGSAIPAGGGWPIDPRQINTREDVVKAFEYLSVLICGAGAKTWTHSTIAEELSALAATEPGTALKLARLYELARYAPLDEPLTRAELLEARRLVCDLAGVDEA